MWEGKGLAPTTSCGFLGDDSDLKESSTLHGQALTTTHTSTHTRAHTGSMKSPPRASHPAPPPSESAASSTQGLVFSQLALILTRLAAYLPAHEAPLLREVSNAFGMLEGQQRRLEEEVERLRGVEQAWQQRSQAHELQQQQQEQEQEAHAMSHLSTVEDPNSSSTGSISKSNNKRIQAYRKAVQERNEKIAQLRQEKEEALKQVNAVHRERLQESESRAHSLEARAERESAEIQQLTHLAMSMQKTLEGLQGQVTLLREENVELKLRLEAAAATASMVGVGVGRQASPSVSPVRGRAKEKKGRSGRVPAAASGAAAARAASSRSHGGGDGRRDALRWGDDDLEDDVEE